MGAMACQITSITTVYSTVYSGADQRKHQSSASLAFVWGIHRWPVISRTNGQLRGKCFHLTTTSWFRLMRSISNGHMTQINNVTTSFWRNNDVIIASLVRWELMYQTCSHWLPHQTLWRTTIFSTHSPIHHKISHLQINKYFPQQNNLTFKFLRGLVQHLIHD